MPLAIGNLKKKIIGNCSKHQLAANTKSNKLPNKLCTKMYSQVSQRRSWSCPACGPGAAPRPRRVPPVWAGTSPGSAARLRTSPARRACSQPPRHLLTAKVGYTQALFVTLTVLENQISVIVSTIVFLSDDFLYIL